MIFAEIMAENGMDDMMQKSLDEAEKLGLSKEERAQFLEKHKVPEQKDAPDKKRQEESFVKKLGLEKSSPEKSFVERMRSAKDGGRSNGGFNEL